MMAVAKRPRLKTAFSFVGLKLLVLSHSSASEWEAKTSEPCGLRPNEPLQTSLLSWQQECSHFLSGEMNCGTASCFL